MKGKTMIRLIGLLLAMTAASQAADTNANWTAPARRPDYSVIYAQGGNTWTQSVWVVGGWTHSRTAGPDASRNWDRRVSLSVTNAPAKK